MVKTTIVGLRGSLCSFRNSFQTTFYPSREGHQYGKFHFLCRLLDVSELEVRPSSLILAWTSLSICRFCTDPEEILRHYQRRFRTINGNLKQTRKCEHWNDHSFRSL